MKATKKARLQNTARAKKIVATMSLEEKVALMGGSISLQDMMAAISASTSAGESILSSEKPNPNHYNNVPYAAGGNDKYDLAPMLFCDGPRGVVCGTGKSTCFPVSMLRGATFNDKLEEEIGHAIGREVRGFGGNLFAGVCINLPYNPGWGRSQESYGEESYALGQFGSALVRGVQEENVIACVKHYAFNSMEISRFKCSVECDRRTEREVFLPHFKDCVDAGAASIMSAYNLYKGTHCGHSDYLLRKVLKEEWDFDGFVMSDFIWGVKNTTEAANNGQDMEMCCTNYFGEKLVKAVQDNLVPEARINDSAERIVRTILTFEDAYKQGNPVGEDVIGCKEHIDLALRAAQQGITLIKNDRELLPLHKAKTKVIAVVGQLANKGNIGDYGSSRVYPAYAVTPLEGFSKVAPEVKVVYCDGSDLEAAKAAAKAADAVVFVVGFNHDDEGEFVAGDQSNNYTESVGGDRINGLGLHADEVTLIKSVAPMNDNSVAVLIGGNTITITEWEKCVGSVMMAYYPGQEGGTAIAQILFGDINPSGKLPFVLPVNDSDLPMVNWETTNQYYDYYHGYTKLEKEKIKPLRHYGFGMSYTTFALSDVHFVADGKAVTADCVVQNTGTVAGAEVVQLYVGFKNSSVDRPVKLLRGFGRIELQPGEKRTVSLSCPVEKLMWFNPAIGAFELEQMEYQVYIGTSSDNNDLIAGTVKL